MKIEMKPRGLSNNNELIPGEVYIRVDDPGRAPYICTNHNLPAHGAGTRSYMINLENGNVWVVFEKDIPECWVHVDVKVVEL